jgi:hypothetical protein
MLTWRSRIRSGSHPRRPVANGHPTPPPPTISPADKLSRHRADRVPIGRCFDFGIRDRIGCGPLLTSQETSLSKHRLVPKAKQLTLGQLLCHVVRDGKEPPPGRLSIGHESVVQNSPSGPGEIAWTTRASRAANARSTSSPRRSRRNRSPTTSPSAYNCPGLNPSSTPSGNAATKMRRVRQYCTVRTGTPAISAAWGAVQPSGCLRNRLVVAGRRLPEAQGLPRGHHPHAPKRLARLA